MIFGVEIENDKLNLIYKLIRMKRGASSLLTKWGEDKPTEIKTLFPENMREAKLHLARFGANPVSS